MLKMMIYPPPLGHNQLPWTSGQGLVVDAIEGRALVLSPFWVNVLANSLRDEKGESGRLEWERQISERD